MNTEKEHIWAVQIKLWQLYGTGDSHILAGQMFPDMVEEIGVNIADPQMAMIHALLQLPEYGAAVGYLGYDALTIRVEDNRQPIRDPAIFLTLLTPKWYEKHGFDENEWCGRVEWA